MFEHIVTVINVLNGQFYKCEVSDVFYHVDKIVSTDGKGEKYTNVHQTIFSDKTFDKYVEKHNFKGDKETFTLKENDIIVKSKITDLEEINNLEELQKSNLDYFLIKTISDNKYGSILLQNIEVTD